MATTSNSDKSEAITEQISELMRAQTLNSDLDFAFNLQLEEAMAISLTILPSSSSSSSSTSSSSPPPISSNGGNLEKEVEKAEQERSDYELCEIIASKSREDLSRRIHDQKFAIDVLLYPEDEWEGYGDEFERPFGEGSSSSDLVDNVNFRLYFKGLVVVEKVGGSEVTLTGIGVAICDPRDNLIFKLSKPLVANGVSRQITEIKALIEGLETAISLEIKRITCFCDYPTIYQYVRQRWQPKGRKAAMLMEKVEFLQKKFTYCHPSLVARKDVKYAFMLARDAIVSQLSRPGGTNRAKVFKETCVICLEETDKEKMFTIDGCLHKYCFSCMKQHVEAKLHSGILPKCPHESCKSKLNVTSCEKFLTQKLIDIMKQRIREASMPLAEKVYCPYPRCSALLSKVELCDFAMRENVGKIMSGARICMKCRGLFCVTCKVPWHENTTCKEYKRLNPYPQPEEAKLKTLATRNLWRQCVKCNHMIELVEGCYHMRCRCGYEFCYSCGAPWKDKQATCSCPLWDEENILLDDDSDFDDEDYDDDDDFYVDTDDSYLDSNSDSD